MAVSVRIPTILRTYTGGESEVSAEGDTLAAVLDDLDARYSGIKGRILDEAGRLRRFVQGRLKAKPVEGTPTVYASGQGGLLDIVLHPGFASNQVVYLSQSAQVDGGALTRVVRARYTGGSLREVTPIFDARPAQASGSNHFGSRIAFDAGGLMYVTAGERYQMPRAQKLDDLGNAGKAADSQLVLDGRLQLGVDRRVRLETRLDGVVTGARGDGRVVRRHVPVVHDKIPRPPTRGNICCYRTAMPEFGHDCEIFINAMWRLRGRAGHRPM